MLASSIFSNVNGKKLLPVKYIYGWMDIYHNVCNIITIISCKQLLLWFYFTMLMFVLVSSPFPGFAFFFLLLFF